MEAGPPSPQIIRFGVYEVDLRAEELRKDGIKIRLRGQPFQVLAMLLERPGQVVTREELQKRLWPDGTFVDFDHSLNTAITKIREVLVDSAEEPRYVETVPRRGYRFVAAVQRPDQAVASDPSKSNAQTNGPLVKPRELISREDSKQSRRWRAWATLVAAVLILSGLIVFTQTYPLPSPKILGSLQITNDGQQKVFSYDYWSPIVTDGSRLYFRNLRQVSVTGGETARLQTALEDVGIADISPSRTELLITSGWSGTVLDIPIWILPLPAGSPRRVGEVSAHDATWSRDGQQITYAFGKELYLANGGGTESRKLVTLPGTAFWLRWSPDGSRLRFTLQESGKTAYSLWEVGADGTHLHPLLSGWNDPAAECCGNWTVDGNYFVFQSSLGGQPGIWAMPETRSWFRKTAAKPVQLTVGPMDLFSPVPSTDGKRLYVIGRQRRGELVRYDWNSRELVPYLSGISAAWLAFSKDGEWIAYVSYPEGILWRSKTDGTERQQLSFPPMRVVMPRWSPDGKQIAFIGILTGKPWKIYLIPATGGNSQQVIPGGRSEVDQDWSPDGNSMVFGRLIPQHLAEEGPLTLHLLDLRTHELSALPDSEGLYTPRWSPNGSTIVAMSEDSKRMVAFDFTTRRWTELARAHFISYFSWSKDGKHIYLDATWDSQRAISRLSIRGGTIERLYSLKDTRQVYGDYGSWFGLDPEDSPLITRDVGTQEIYALNWEAP